MCPIRIDRHSNTKLLKQIVHDLRSARNNGIQYERAPSRSVVAFPTCACQHWKQRYLKRMHTMISTINANEIPDADGLSQPLSASVELLLPL